MDSFSGKSYNVCVNVLKSKMHVHWQKVSSYLCNNRQMYVWYYLGRINLKWKIVEGVEQYINHARNQTCDVDKRD